MGGPVCCCFSGGGRPGWRLVLPPDCHCCVFRDGKDHPPPGRSPPQARARRKGCCCCCCAVRQGPGRRHVWRRVHVRTRVVDPQRVVVCPRVFGRGVCRHHLL